MSELIVLARMTYTWIAGPIRELHTKITQVAQGNFTGRVQVWHVFVLASCLGVVNAFDIPARQAFVVEMVGREDLLNAISLNSSIVDGARIVGPSVAGLMIGAVGVTTCFLLNGMTFIAVIAGLLMMRLPPSERPAHAVSAGEHAWNGIVYSIKHQRVRTVLLLFLAVGVFGWSYAVLMPAFARDVLGRGANGYGMLMSASGTGAFIAALVVATYGHLFTPRRLALGGVWLFSIALFAFSLSRNFYLALVFLLVAGFGMLLFFSTSNTVLQTIVPDEMRGRVMGVWSLVFGAMIPLGSLEAGALAHWLGTPFALSFGATICAVAALVTLFVIQRREASIMK